MARALFGCFFAIVGILLPVVGATAQQLCPQPDLDITLLSSSYCELCAGGEVTLRIANNTQAQPGNTGSRQYRNENRDFSNVQVTLDLGQLDQVYTPGSVTWNISSLPRGAWTDRTVTLSPIAGAQEQLVAISRQIAASATYTYGNCSGEEYRDSEGGWSNDWGDWEALPGSGSPSSESENFTDELPIKEPGPVVRKAVRNVDAGMPRGFFSNSASPSGDVVYGHEDDGIIWRIIVRNGGDAPMYDVIFDDTMNPSGAANMDMVALCRTEADAEQVANGANPSSLTSCYAISGDSLSGRLLSDFGYGNSIAAGSSVTLYLAGYLRNSCTGQVNTFDGVEWGCFRNGSSGPRINNPGDISAGVENGLPNYSDNSARFGVLSEPNLNRGIQGLNNEGRLNYDVEFFGLHGESEPVGMRGMVRITLQNLTGGTINKVVLTDTLPDEYILDPNFEPQFEISSFRGNYQAYAGRVSRLDWVNRVTPVAGNQSYLSDARLKAPVFRLTSDNNSLGTMANGDPDQVDLLRHGDEVTITFRIIQVNQNESLTYYDRMANLDNQDESGEDPDYSRIDPPAMGTLTNRLKVRWGDFCATNGYEHDDIPEAVQEFTPDPENLNVSIPDPLYIIRDEGSTPVRVNIWNSGGHTASDYLFYVTFGETINVDSAPAQCAQTTNPPYLSGSQVPLWNTPAWWNDGNPNSDGNPLPNSAKVYACDVGDLAGGASETLEFWLSKNHNVGDDLTMRADVIGQITLAEPGQESDWASSGEALVYPTPANLNGVDGTTPSQQLANNYTLDAVRGRALGFNLLKRYVPGSCKEAPNRGGSDGDGRNSPPHILVGEECDFDLYAGGWFGFETPGWNITVDSIAVADALPLHAGGDDSNTGRQHYIRKEEISDVCSTSGLPHSPSSVCRGVITPSGFSPSAPLEEGPANSLSWTFGGTQVTSKDYWFLANMTTRLRNEQEDQVSSPNQHGGKSVDYGRTSFQVTYADNDGGEIFSEVVANDGSGGKSVCYKSGDDWENPQFGAGQACNPDYPGYPQWQDWTAQLTITEPKLHITKEVCNFTQAGENLSACVWEDENVRGSKFDDFVYRITVENRQEDGPTAAPAYDVVITDILDSPQICVWPFDRDDLNNTPEGDFGLVGIDNIGANNYQYDPSNPDADIHCKENGESAYITFSYDHSDALKQIDAGDSVELFYRVTPHRTVVPNQMFDNTANIFRYDSLSAEAGNQTAPRIENVNHPGADGSVPPRADNRAHGGARIYCVDGSDYCGSDAARMTIIGVDSEPKAVVETSTYNAGIATDPDMALGPIVGPDDRVDVVVGEEVRFRLVGTVPAARLRNLTFRDELPDGLRCVEVEEVDLSALDPDANWYTGDGPTTPKEGTTCSGNIVEWRYGDQYLLDYDTSKYGDFDGLFPITLTFVARVENNSITAHGATLTNPGGVAQMTYEDAAGNLQQPANFDPISLNVRGPRIELTKEFSVEEVDADDIVTVTVTATNPDSATSATAYDLRVLNDLRGTKYRYVEGSEVGVDVVDFLDGDTNAPIFRWNRNDTAAPYAIPVGGSVTFSYKVRVVGETEEPGVTVAPHEELMNTIEARWQSLPGNDIALNASGLIGDNGAEDGMRIGDLPGVAGDVNDYETDAQDSTTVWGLQFTKADITADNSPESRTIGSHRRFELVIDLPEGITSGVEVTDNLNNGTVSYVLNTADANFPLECEYRDIEAIDSGAGPVSAPAIDSGCSLLGVPANDSADTVIWNIGTVDTASEDDSAANDKNPQIRIRYWARINNDDATDDGDELSNRATLEYTNGQDGSTEQLQPPATAPVTAAEPRLKVAKTVANKNGNVNAQGGDTLVYTLEISHEASNSAAYDLSIVDSLAPELVLDTGSINLTLQGAGCAAVDSFQLQPQTQPDGSVAWGRIRGDDSLDLPLGCAVTLTYEASVQGAFGGVIENSVLVGWTSQNQTDPTQPYERDDSDCIGNAGGVASGRNDYCTYGEASIVTEDNTFLTKTVVSDSYDPENDASVRIGDTVTYSLQLGLQPGMTQELVVTDELPAGLVLETIVSTSCDDGYTCSSVTLPTLPATGTVEWRFGDVERNNPAPFEIQYIARVVDDPALAGDASIELRNRALLSYVGSDGHPTPTDLQDEAAITVLQPVFDPLVKSERGGKPNPYTVVDLINDVMQFRLQACNSGGAPAYGIELTDDLAPQMDQTSIENLALYLFDGTNLEPLVDGTDYTYTAPQNPGEDMLFQVSRPVAPGQCLYIDYDIGFQSEVGGGETWDNTFTINQHWSQPDASGRQYAALPEAAPFVMTTAEANAGPLLKELISPDDGTATIGEEVRYRITIPQTPVPTSSLTDVVVTDTLDGLGDIMVFESATLNGAPITPASPTDLTFDIGVITAGTSAELEIVARVADVDNAVDGTVIVNSADYSYSEGGNTVVGGGNSVELTIVEPKLIMDKQGPDGGTLQSGVPGRFVLDLRNEGGGEAWDITVVDLLPDTDQGGLCQTPPQIAAVEIVDAGGTVLSVLAESTDYSAVFDADNCTLTLTGSGANAVLLPEHHLRISYDAYLDADTEHNASLTNVAGATLWYSLESTQTGARVYDPGFTNDPPDGTPSVEDHEDAYTLTAEVPRISFHKAVANLTSGLTPAATAAPGDQLQYTLTLTNLNDLDVENIEITDELGRLNALPLYESGTLQIVSVPMGADTSGTDAMGGTHGSGLLNVSGLSLAAGETLEIIYEVTLAAVIDSGTTVLNQAQVQLPGQALQYSDDPNINGADDPDTVGDEDPTQILIESAPLLVVEKTSADLTGDPDLLLAGDTLRYTIRVENTGNENIVDAMLRDQVPANTTYVPGSTTLNGAMVDDVNGSTPLAAGMSINSPGAGEGFVGATAAGAAPVVVTFDVTINDVNDGTVISNQGYVNGAGAGSGAFDEVPSDDPSTDTPNDPTIDIVGDLPLLIALKTVEIVEDNLSAGVVDPGDVLRYTIAVTNMGGVDATRVALTDPIPANTTYVAGSTTLNGMVVADNAGGMSRLDAGLPISSADLTPPLPGADEGVITSMQTATVTFDVMVNADTPRGTIISNQGSVYSEELPLTLTDADGNPANGAQPTLVVVGDAQQLAITKEVAVVGGGAAEAGAILEYLITVTNISAVPATYVVITDDLLVAGENVLTYVEDSAQLNGQADGITVVDTVISADYSALYGELQPNEMATLRFQAKLSEDLEIGYRVLNTAEVRWNDPPMYNQASVAIDVGGTPGIANVSGYLWHDVNFNERLDADESLLSNWTVDLYFNNALLETVQSDDQGYFQFQGLVPNYMEMDAVDGASYELRFTAPDAGENTASLGNTSSDYTDGPQHISAIFLESGANPQNLNLPITPNGTVYDSVLRQPLAGATLTMLRASSGQALPARCFDDEKQQNQVSLPGGYYKFDINFSDPACPAHSDYLIQVQAPGDDFVSGPSQIIPAQTSADTAGFDVAACLGSSADKIPGTAEHCEVQLSELPPPVDIDARDEATDYYLRLTLDDDRIPGESQLFNNHIPVDPQLEGALTITKTAALLNVTRAQLVPYTITFGNTLPVPMTDLQLVDFFPAGFKYVSGSARLDGEPLEPEVNGLQLIWSDLRVEAEQTREMKLLLVVGSGVSEGEYVNRARMFNQLSGQVASAEASATVRVVPDPTFDCTDVIGKVYDDKNMNGYQDPGEGGVPGARVVTATGLNATTDAYGRFHITCAVVPDENRGSNFIMKLDDRSLPSGYRLTTENPRVVRATRGKAVKINFGASLHRVVRLDMAEAVFEPGTTELRPQWHSRVDLLLEKLSEAPSVLRLAYLAENENPDLVDARLAAIKARIADAWASEYDQYELTIETEIFWRRGAPPSRGGLQ
ncbi:hypothetical protein OQJ59_03530 [Microbulbifer thermotolerans]|uniref:hypothetical protein n=1 Tax=Microbulbifer thermotolerans TaxID=252514 RepID=UPI00224ADDBC|nr:hypothetical protein [Microbulbifer thermotolerans]MCX2840683.1 hypothetical protein [Microbulbifer thermotolerans]